MSDGDKTVAAQGARRPGSQGRADRREARAKRSAQHAPYIQRKIGYFDILSEEGQCLIENNADAILQEIGMEFRGDPEILDIFQKAGADVKGERVRFERGMCRAIVKKTAPKSFIQQARNPAKSVRLGEGSMVLCPVFGPPFIHNLDEGRRYASIKDTQNLIKIHQMLPYLHHSGGVICEPVDLPANKRHLDILYAHIRYSDRPFFGALIGELLSIEVRLVYCQHSDLGLSEPERQRRGPLLPFAGAQARSSQP